MRRLVTFILRLWVDLETDPLACEGQVECVATSEQAHVRQPEDITHFIQSHLDVSQPESQQASAENSHQIKEATE